MLLEAMQALDISFHNAEAKVVSIRISIELTFVKRVIIFDSHRMV